jgi:hypothetical protein
MVDRRKRLPLGQVRVGDHLGGREHGGRGNPCGRERLHRVLDRLESVEPRANDRVQVGPVLAAPRRRGEARIRGQVGPVHHRHEPRPELRRPDRLHRHVAAADPVHDHARARAAIFLPVVQHAAVVDVLRADEALEHRDVEVGAPARPRAPPEGGQDRPEGVGAREHVGRLKISGPRRRVGLLLQVHDAGHRVDDVVEGRLVAQGPALAEAGDGAVHEVGLHRRERGVVASELRDDAGQEILDDDVGGPRQVEQDLARLRMREVEREARLARVDPDEVRGLVSPSRFHLGVAAPRVVAFARALDLDHARAQVGEQSRAIRTGQHTREIENGEAGEQRVVRAGHGRSPTRGF